MRRPIAALLSLAAAVGVTLAVTTRASAGPVAQAAATCRSYTTTTHRTFGHVHYTYRTRIGRVHRSGVSCASARRMIYLATFPNEPAGRYGRVETWECRSFRPFAGGPHREFMWLSNCKRRGGSLSWTNTEISEHHTG